MTPAIREAVEAVLKEVPAQGGTLLRTHEAPHPEEVVDVDATLEEFLVLGRTLGGNVFYLHVEEEDAEDGSKEPVALTVSFLREARFHTFYVADPEWEERMLEAEEEEDEHDHEHEVDLAEADPAEIAEDIVGFAEEGDYDFRRDVNKVIEDYWKSMEVGLDELSEEERRVVMKANALARMAAKRS